MQSECESNFKFLYSGSSPACGSCHQVNGSKMSLALAQDEELKKEILWERLDQVDASALSVASPGGKEL